MRVKACLGLIPGASFQRQVFDPAFLDALHGQTRLPIPVTVEFAKLAVGNVLALSRCALGGLDVEIELDAGHEDLLARFAHLAPAWIFSHTDGVLQARLQEVSFTASPAPVTLPEISLTLDPATP